MMTSARSLTTPLNPTPGSADAEPALQCCDQPDQANPTSCSLCHGTACGACAITVNGSPTCAGCHLLLSEEEANQTTKISTLPPAVAGGLVGATLAGLAWAAIAMVTNFEIGYVAVGVGWLAGQGVVMGAGPARGRMLQSIAAGTSALGLFLGRYFAFAWEVVEYAKETSGDVTSYFDYRILDTMLENFTGFFGVWDVLWLALALSVAWKLPAAKKCVIS